MMLQTTFVSHAVEATVAVHGTTKRLQDKINMMIKTIKLRLNLESKIPPENTKFMNFLKIVNDHFLVHVYVVFVKLNSK